MSSEIQNTLPDKVQSTVVGEFERRGSESSLRPSFFSK
jgi:hypothetical protein